MSNRRAGSKKIKNGLGRILVISGPSGSGKTTLVKRLLGDKRLKGLIVKSVSLTTRPRRSGEAQNKDYVFISQKEFRARQKAKKILEWTKYLGYYYATPRDFVEGQLQRGRHVVLCLDLKGARQIKRLYPASTKTFFIIPPSLEALKERIEKRCSRTREEEVRRRLRLARKELLGAGRYDYCIANNNLSRAEKRLRKIIAKEIGA